MEILQWFQGFRQECPNGHLSKSHLTKLFRKVFQDGNADTFSQHIFRIFDKESGQIIKMKFILLIVFLTDERKGKRK